MGLSGLGTKLGGSKMDFILLLIVKWKQNHILGSYLVKDKATYAFCRDWLSSEIQM
jgi:hypothetical protein